ncbi:MAG: hypothetical protein E7626_06475 [Ruminococcaceae bacterium]|nr:hypothetical protein [Oscillospiraceae bacterium]
MKKSDLIAIGVILVLISIIFSVCLNFVQQWNYLIHDVGPYEVRDFRSYKKDFKMIAETAISFYDEEKEKNDALIYITIDTLNDTWKIRCVSEAEETYTYKEISEDESRAYSHIREAFPSTEYGWLSLIKVRSDRVVFLTETPYAIVYMRNGKRPKYISKEDEGYESVYVEKLSRRWYQVKGKP